MKRWLAGGLVLVGLCLAGCQIHEQRESRKARPPEVWLQVEVTVRQ